MNRHKFREPVNRRTAELSDMAIDMSKDRRVLLDFLETCAVAPRNNGEYTHSREDLEEKARKILEDMHYFNNS